MVTGDGSPPADEILKSPSFALRAKTMVPSWFHVPPRGSGASHKICGSLPETSTFFSFPSAKNPIKLLSGDQKIAPAPSVPGKGGRNQEIEGSNPEPARFPKFMR